MINDWFECEAFRIQKGEETVVLELHQVRLLRRLGKWKAGESFEWVAIDLFGGAVTLRERKDRIVDHPMVGRLGLAREWRSYLSSWNKDIKRPRADDY